MRKNTKVKDYQVVEAILYRLKQVVNGGNYRSNNFFGTHTSTKSVGDAVAYQGRRKAKTRNMLILTDSKGILIIFSEPIESNQKDEFNLVPIEYEMITGLKATEISTNGLFLYVDSGFDTEEFRSFCSKVEIIGSIDQNKCNGAVKEYLFDDLLYKCRFVVERTKAQA